MRYVKIAHYGGWLLNSLDKYSRRQLMHGGTIRKEIGAKGSLLASQTSRSFYRASWLMDFEQRHVDSWIRLREASRISRRRAARMGAVA